MLDDDWIAQDYHEKKSLYVSQQLYLLSFSLLFFSKPSWTYVIWVTAQSPVYNFSFAVHAIVAPFEGFLFFFPFHVQYSWWHCSSGDSRNEVWFITEDVNIIDHTQGGVGSPLFGLAGYVSFAEKGIPVFKVLTLKQGIQFRYKRLCSMKKHLKSLLRFTATK